MEREFYSLFIDVYIIYTKSRSMWRSASIYVAKKIGYFRTSGSIDRHGQFFFFLLTMSIDGSKHTKLTINQKMAAFVLLWERSKDGLPAHGSMTEVAEIFGLKKCAISRLWRDNGGGNDFKIPHLGKERIERQNNHLTVSNIIEEVRFFFV